MKEEKNHVGRPTNEEVAERKKEKLNKILTPILVVAIVLTLGVLTIQKFNTNNLKGASLKTDLIVKPIQNDKFVVNNCKISLNLIVKNNNKKAVIVDEVQIKGGKGRTTIFDKWTKQTNISGYNKNMPTATSIVLPTFSVGKFPTNSENDKSNTIDVVVVYHFSGETKQYYNYIPYQYTNKLTDNNIKVCKSSTTTTKKVNNTSLSATTTPGKFLTFGSIANNDFFVGNCNTSTTITIKKNKGKKTAIIDSVALKTGDGKTQLSSFDALGVNIAADRGGTVHPLFQTKYFPLRSENKNNNNIKFVVLYHFSGETQRYYQAVSYAYTTKLVDSNITTCRNQATTTTKKATEATKTAESFTLTCPSNVKVNNEFTCKTNKTMVKISLTTDGLHKDYKSDFVTTLKDKTKVAKYTKPGVVTVTAIYGSKIKKVKVNVLPVDDKLTINCTGSFKVSKDIKCTTNEAGVTISVPATNLKKGYTTSFTTTDKDKVKWVNYTKAGNYTIKATKGNRSNSLTIKISK